MITSLFFVVGCADGKDGSNGQDGAIGAQGPTGPEGPSGMNTPLSTKVEFLRSSAPTTTLTQSSVISNNILTLPNRVSVNTARTGFMADRLIIRTVTNRIQGTFNLPGDLNPVAFGEMRLLDSSNNVHSTGTKILSRISDIDEVSWEFFGVNFDNAGQLTIEIDVIPGEALAFGESTVNFIMNFEDALNLNQDFPRIPDGTADNTGGSIEASDLDPLTGAIRVVPISEICGEDSTGLFGKQFVLNRTDFIFPKRLEVLETTPSTTLVANTSILSHQVTIINRGNEEITITSASYSSQFFSGLNLNQHRMEDGANTLFSFSSSFPSFSFQNIIVPAKGTFVLEMESEFTDVFTGARLQYTLTSLDGVRFAGNTAFHFSVIEFTSITGPLLTD